MSNENRSKVLLGFGALVVVLVAAIALWPPNFRKEDASGAIGEVQKHRAPQITQKDVILGNESVKHQQKVLYADFLTDAAKLRSMAAAHNYGAAAAFSNELRTRYTAEAGAALAEAEEMASHSSASRAKAQTEIAEARSILNRKNLSRQDMNEFSGKLALIIVVCSEEMSARSMSRVFNDAGQELSAAASRLKGAKLESEYLAATKQVEDAEALMARPLSAVSLADEGQYLAQMQMEAKVVADAEALAGRQIADQEVADEFSLAAEQLETKAMDNIKANAALMSEMSARLGSMNEAIELATHNLGSRAGIQAGSAEVLSRHLASARETVRSREEAFYAQANVAASEEILAAKRLNSSQLQNELMNLQGRLQARPQQ